MERELKDSKETKTEKKVEWGAADVFMDNWSTEADEKISEVSDDMAGLQFVVVYSLYIASVPNILCDLLGQAKLHF